MNLAGLLDDAAREHGARRALYSDGASIDFAELQRRSARFAGLLRDRGTRPGDRVALVLPNAPAFVAAYYGVLRVGAVVVPLNVLLRSGEIAHRLAHSGSRLLVTVPERVGELREVAERHAVAVVDPAAAEGADALSETLPREPGETAVLLYTSGTTCGPKGAELTHRRAALGGDQHRRRSPRAQFGRRRSRSALSCAHLRAGRGDERVDRRRSVPRPRAAVSRRGQRSA
jgi:long-chain acyl-CoA synthetase